MADRKELGRIIKATFGFGGYQDACIGLSLTFGGAGWGVSTFIGGWATEPGERAQWTIEDRDREWANAVQKLSETLTAARREHVEQLAGTPVIVTFAGNVLKDWRVLAEVLG